MNPYVDDYRVPQRISQDQLHNEVTSDSSYYFSHDNLPRNSPFEFSAEFDGRGTAFLDNSLPVLPKGERN